TEMDNDATVTEAAAQAKITGALSASQLAFSGQPLDVMADYTATSADSAQLRYVAGAVATIVSSAVDAGNGAQSTFDCNDVEIFDPAVVALDQQLTSIANGTFQFSQLTAAQQANVAQNPGNYPSYFVDGASLTTAIENELAADADSIAADLFEEVADRFAQQF